jgi:hypothetical protein
MAEAVKERRSGDIVVAIHSYLNLALDEQIKLNDLPWYEIVAAFMTIRTMNTLPVDLPMLKFPFRGPENVTAPWNHPQRPFIMWIHVLAANYGWTLTEIRNLWPEDAAMYVQEITTDEQLQKEWEYMLSTVAHPRDEKGRDLFKPLRRPAWMSPRPRKTKLAKKSLPMGNIINISGIEDEDLDE